jgi:hypothetical protein
MVCVCLSPEPLDVKEIILRTRDIFRGILTDPFRINRLSAWSINVFPKYLWRYWGDELRRNRYTWQRFLKALRLRTYGIAEWTLGRISWSRLIGEIVKVLEEYR